MANDHLTLEEIEGQHDTMVERVIAKSSDREFTSQLEALKYIAWCIHKGLTNLGIRINSKIPEKIVQRIMEVKKLKIEQHTWGEHPGTFIYIDDELQYFISDPEIKKSQIVFHKPHWVVRTNVQ